LSVKITVFPFKLFIGVIKSIKLVLVIKIFPSKMMYLIWYDNKRNQHKASSKKNFGNFKFYNPKYNRKKSWRTVSTLGREKKRV